MISHQPPDYDCPFCLIQEGRVNERNQPSDLVGDNDLAYARISPKWWPGNPGHAVGDLTRDVASAMRAAYPCEGVSTRQHNEPAGDQDVWHLHVHVFPRHDGDHPYLRHREGRYVTPAERPRAERLRAELCR